MNIYARISSRDIKNKKMNVSKARSRRDVQYFSNKAGIEVFVSMDLMSNSGWEPEMYIHRLCYEMG